jgi:quercetin dioxygenase-like cupin family protein
MQSWNLREIETPGGSRSPVVLDPARPVHALVIGLEPGQELGEHEVKEHAFLLVVDGTVRIEAGNQTVEASPGMPLRL